MESDLKSTLLRAAALEPSPTRAQVERRSRLTVIVAAAISCGIFVWAGGLRLYQRPTLLVGQTAATAALIAIASSWGALPRGRRMVGASTEWLLAVVLVTPLALLGAKLLFSLSHAGMTDPWPERVGFRCLLLSLTVAAAPLAAFCTARRGAQPVNEPLVGAALGVAAGAWSWVLVDLWCPVAHVPHLLLGHVAPLIMLCVVGWLAAPRLLNPAFRVSRS